MNTANPAPCAGNITSWRICYYGPSSVDQNSRVSYTSTYAVYRRTGSGEDLRYERVGDTFRAIVTTTSLGSDDPDRSTIDAIIQQNGFNCFDDTNSLNVPLSVQAGDFVGACIFDPPNVLLRFSRDQLDFVGRGGGESLLEMSNVDGCSVDSLPSSVQADDLSTVNRRLHIYANIG